MHHQSEYDAVVVVISSNDLFVPSVMAIYLVFEYLYSWCRGLRVESERVMLRKIYLVLIIFTYYWLTVRLISMAKSYPMFGLLFVQLQWDSKHSPISHNKYTS